MFYEIIVKHDEKSKYCVSFNCVEALMVLVKFNVLLI